MTTVSIPIRGCVEGEVHSISFDDDRNVWINDHDWLDDTLVDLGLDKPKCIKVTDDLKEYLDHEYEVMRLRLNHEDQWQWFGRCLCEIASGWIIIGKWYSHPKNERICYLLDEEDSIRVIGEVANGVISYVMPWITPDMCQGKDVIPEQTFLEVVDDITLCLLFFNGVNAKKKSGWTSRKSRIFDITSWSHPERHKNLCDRQLSLLSIISRMCFCYPDPHFSYRSAILPNEKLFDALVLAIESIRDVAVDYILGNGDRMNKAYKDSTEHGIAQPYHPWWKEYILYEIVANALSRHTKSVVVG